MDQTVTALTNAEDVRLEIVTIAQQQEAGDRRKIAMDSAQKRREMIPRPGFSTMDLRVRRND
ncbi:hypothetical protein [Agrobacterium sp. OT33]|uniref:hypothetical protein n=1 Tax=Agrobacterium sp. OT33 TaxID=2815338 RepID=UPI001A8E2789|nr:hypothetical protein [Agrobacterium sp. OT33]MBO0126934.1 hypothetical protein [Agrobacterium sp. OT33]